MQLLEINVVDWSRALFALTALYHWLFVPLTIGLSAIIAIYETIYYKTKDERWKEITKFWMRLLGINYAIGVATGLILEFEFGTNWAKFSWMAGDIFGAPLAIEGIMAFFLESTFIVVMIYGWEKVSRKFHLISTYLVAIGALLSALWILVTNAWLQYPTGMHFNPDMARFEMINFWEVLFSPVAINKFFHTIFAVWTIGATFVLMVGSCFLLKKVKTDFAIKSMKVATVFGLFSILALTYTGDGSAYYVAQKQPLKLASMEGLFQGKNGAGLVAFGILNPNFNIDNQNVKQYYLKIEIPKMLSILGHRSPDAFVSGVNDHYFGNKQMGLLSIDEKMMKGKAVVKNYNDYLIAKKLGDTIISNNLKNELKNNINYMGYGYLNKPEEVLPNIPVLFYSFHFMASVGFFLIALFFATTFMLYKNKFLNNKLALITIIISFPLAFIGSQTGWLVAELGRQPWTIQHLLPTSMAISPIDSISVQITFWLFALFFTVLLVTEISILTRQIKNKMTE